MKQAERRDSRCKAEFGSNLIAPCRGCFLLLEVIVYVERMLGCLAWTRHNEDKTRTMIWRLDDDQMSETTTTKMLRWATWQDYNVMTSSTSGAWHSLCFIIDKSVSKILVSSVSCSRPPSHLNSLSIAGASRVASHMNCRTNLKCVFWLPPSRPWLVVWRGNDAVEKGVSRVGIIHCILLTGALAILAGHCGSRWSVPCIYCLVNHGGQCIRVHMWWR